MSAHVLLNLLNELRESNKMLGLLCCKFKGKIAREKESIELVEHGPLTTLQHTQKSKLQYSSHIN